VRHHVVLISLDALRADRLGCYGGVPPLSPAIDELAADSLRFRRALTPATWTVPAHISMLSGLEPMTHGCISALRRYPPEELPFPLLFELLAEASYVPLAITGGGYMEAQFGFGRGVDDFRIMRRVHEAMSAVVEHAASAELTFAFVHSYVVHDYPRVSTDPYTLLRATQAVPDYSGLFSRDRDFHTLLTALATSADLPPITADDLKFIDTLYLASVEIADTAIRALCDDLRSRGLWQDTTIVLTADHGESLGDLHEGRRYFAHGGPPYEDQIHVPLIVRPAPSLMTGLEPAILADAVSLCDIVPTVLELASLPHRREQFDGYSLLDLCRGQVAAFETRRLFCHSCDDPRDRYLAPSLYGTCTSWRGTGKLIFDHRRGALRGLYWLDRDPLERDNRVADLTQDELRLISDIISGYFERQAARAYHPEGRPIDDPALLERLADLGYLE
jgi:arylsulfatase A-like enzyme